MKKIYIIPETDIKLGVAEQMLAASTVVGNIDNNNEIGFGGIDDDGTLEPGVKEHTADYEWEF